MRVRSMHTIHTHSRTLHECRYLIHIQCVLLDHLPYSLPSASFCYTDESQVFNRRDEQHEALLSWAGLDLGTERMGIGAGYFWCCTTTFQSPNLPCSFVNMKFWVLEGCMPECEIVNVGTVVAAGRTVQFISTYLPI